MSFDKVGGPQEKNDSHHTISSTYLFFFVLGVRGGGLHGEGEKKKVAKAWRRRPLVSVVVWCVRYRVV